MSQFLSILVCGALTATSYAADINGEARYNRNPNYHLPNIIKGDTTLLTRIDKTSDPLFIASSILNGEKELGFINTASLNPKKSFTHAEKLKKMIRSDEESAYFIGRTREDFSTLPYNNLTLVQLTPHTPNNPFHPDQPILLRSNLLQFNVINIQFHYPKNQPRNNRHEISILNSLIFFSLNNHLPYGKIEGLTSYVNPNDHKTIELLEKFNFKKRTVHKNTPPSTHSLLNEHDFYIWTPRIAPKPEEYLEDLLFNQSLFLERSTFNDKDFLIRLHQNPEILKERGMNTWFPKIKIKKPLNTPHYLQDSSKMFEMYKNGNPTEAYHIASMNPSALEKAKTTPSIMPLSPASSYLTAFLYVTRYVMPNEKYNTYIIKKSKSSTKIGFMQVCHYSECPKTFKEIPYVFHPELKQNNAIRLHSVMDPIFNNITDETNAIKTMVKHIYYNHPYFQKDLPTSWMIVAHVSPLSPTTYNAFINSGFEDREPNKQASKKHLLSREIR